MYVDKRFVRGLVLIIVSARPQQTSEEQDLKSFTLEE